MKRMAAVLAALGISGAAFAHDVSDDVTQMQEQSYEAIASGEAIPSDESAYGYSLDDPYTDPYADQYSDTVVLIPMDDEEGG